jgi:hypothetical protein
MRELHEKRLHSPDTFALDARWDTTSFVGFLGDCCTVALMICWCYHVKLLNSLTELCNVRADPWAEHAVPSSSRRNSDTITGLYWADELSWEIAH